MHAFASVAPRSMPEIGTYDPQAAVSAGQGVHNMRILVVDAHPTMRQVLARVLRQLGATDVYQAGDAPSALDAFQRLRPDVVLLDIRLPGQDGYWLTRRLRECDSGDWTPIVFLSALNSDMDVWRAIEAGGDDYLVKPVKPMVLMAKLRAMQRLLDMRRRLVTVSDELNHANQRLNEMIEIDPLTGLVNRRGLERILHTEIHAARRDLQPLTLMLCDLDHFKDYNDTLGHVKGDECLREVGKLLKEVCMRPRDVAFRFGGGEFALLLPNTPRSGAMTFARTTVSLLRTRSIPHPASTVSHFLTVSGGITTCIPDSGTDAETMLRRADEALYAAKAQGRDRFFSFEMQMDTIEPTHAA